MRDIKIYVVTIIASIFLLIPALFGESRVYNVLSGIGCSGIAAAAMAIFLERANGKRELEKAERTKSIYFRRLYDQLIMTMERILWFNERLGDDEFIWDLPDQEYYSLNYMISMSTRYPERSLSYSSAIDELRAIGEKYNIEGIKRLSEHDKNKICRLFQIVAISSASLLDEARIVNENKLLLDIEDYLSIDGNEQILFQISLSIGLMSRQDKNYKAAIECLISATDRLRTVGLYANSIQVGLHGSVSINEL